MRELWPKRYGTFPRSPAGGSSKVAQSHYVPGSCGNWHRDSGTGIGVNISQEEIDSRAPQMDAELAPQDIADFLESQPRTSIDRIFAFNISNIWGKDKTGAIARERAPVPSSRQPVRGYGANATSPFGGMTRY